MTKLTNKDPKPESVLCDVYKSAKQAEVYLYVLRQEGLARVPEELLQRFTDPELSLSFKLSPDRKLAREDSRKVFSNLIDQGYHLQMPPVILGRLGKKDSE